MVELPVVRFLIASAFLGSVGFAIFLRRIDAPAARISQVRRQGEIQTEKLDDLASSRIQAIRDATIEFELMIRQSRRLKDELGSDLELYQSRLTGLKQDRDILENIAAELSQVAGSARTVASQVDRLDSGLQRLAYAQEEIGSIRTSMDDLNRVVDHKAQEAEARLGELVARLIQDAESSTRLLTDQTRAGVQNLKEEYQDLTFKLEDQFKQMHVLSERISSLNMRMDEKWNQDSGRLDEKFNQHERNYLDRISSIEAGLGAIKNAAMDSMQADLSRMRSELDALNLAGIARRDEIMNETKQMAEGVRSQVSDFHEKHLAAENRLQKLEQKRINEIESKIRGIEDEFDSVREKQVNKLEQETHQSLEIIRAEAGESAALVRETRISEEENLSKIKEEILRMREEYLDKSRKIETSLLEAARIRGRVEEYGEQTKDEIAANSGAIIKDMEKKAERFLDEQDEKLSRINQTIDEKISRQIVQLVDRGQFQLDELEKRTESAIKDASERMKDQIERAKDDFRKMRDDVTREIEVVHALRDQVLTDVEKEKGRMKGLTEKLEVLSKAETLASKLDETVEILTERLELAREENSHLDEYVRNFEAVRIGRKELEGELRNLEFQRDRIQEAEKLMQRMNEESQALKERFDELDGSDEIADRLEERMKGLIDLQATFEKSYHDVMDKRKMLEQSVRTMETARKQASEAKQSAETLLVSVDRAEFRQKEVDKQIQSMESRTVQLGRMEKEIEKVESRFSQMEGLMVDLEEKQKQIGSMFRKIEEIQEQGQDLRGELESSLTEADEKMDRLTAFYQTVDKFVDSSLEKADEEVRKQDAPKRIKKKGGGEALRRESILSLHMNHKWDADLIADRLKMDPATVRAIISHS